MSEGRTVINRALSGFANNWLGISGIPVMGKNAPYRVLLCAKNSAFLVWDPVGVVHAAVAYFTNETFQTAPTIKEKGRQKRPITK